MTKNKSLNFLLQTLGCLISAAGIYSFAVAAGIPVTGVAGISAILYRLFGVPMGLSNVLINIPIILCTYKLLGRAFFLRSVYCMILFAISTDYVLPLLPVYQGDRLLATICAGVVGGIGDALIYMNNSSTGGLDFITMAIKARHPYLAFGNITFAAALACFYCRIPVGHVEAGLRTYQMDSPFPEEFNRQTVSSIAGLHFAPTQYAADNLLREGCPGDRIFVTGNTGIDALRYTVRRDYAHPVLDWAADSRLVLMTAHRRESLGEPMRNMFRAVRQVLEEQPGVKIVYPIHKNPAVRQIACEILSNHPCIRLTEPLDVLDFHNFMAKSHLILTDSGGIQEEAPFLGKPVLVMRDTTERPEGIAAGTLKLVGTEEGEIYRAFTRLLTEKNAYEAMAHAASPYGQGYASSTIADVLEAQL